MPYGWKSVQHHGKSLIFPNKVARNGWDLRHGPGLIYKRVGQVLKVYLKGQDLINACSYNTPCAPGINLFRTRKEAIAFAINRVADKFKVVKLSYAKEDVYAKTMSKIRVRKARIMKIDIVRIDNVTLHW